MNDKAFVDTNVLIYSIEPSKDMVAKSTIAREILAEGAICLSTQVLGEFYRATTHSKRAQPLAHDEAVAWIQLWKRFEVASITTDHVDQALEIRNRFQLAYYDSLILAAARLAGCSKVYSEDMSHNEDYKGVRVVNPFVE